MDHSPRTIAELSLFLPPPIPPPFLAVLHESVLFLIESDYGNASSISNVATANVNNLKWPWEAGLFEIHWICGDPRSQPRLFAESQCGESRLGSCDKEKTTMQNCVPLCTSICIASLIRCCINSAFVKRGWQRDMFGFL